MTIDPGSYTPAYVQLAEIIRDEIVSGRLRPGQTIASEVDLMQEHGVARATARRAIALLRAEGVIRTEHGIGSYVPDDGDPDEVEVSGPVEVSARMPTPAERRALDIPEGVPVLIVREGDGEPRVLPAHTHIVNMD